MREVGPWRLLELRRSGAYGVVYLVEPVGQPGAGPFALKLALHAKVCGYALFRLVAHQRMV
jgi:hypothetical protein